MASFRILVPLLIALLLGPAMGSAATFNGEFWDASTPVSNMGQANAIIAAGPATSTFRSTAIDYPNGSANNISSNTLLSTFLGADAASIVGPANRTITQSVFRFTGFLDLLPGPNRFTVGSDDGFRLTIGGVQIAQQFNSRAFSLTNVTTTAGSGKTAFELIYFENAGNTGVLFNINNALAVPAAVPLPPAVLMLIAAMLGLGAISRPWRRVADL